MKAKTKNKQDKQDYPNILKSLNNKIEKLVGNPVISLYKVLKNHPEFNDLNKSVHVYLAGIVIRSLNPEQDKIYKAYAAQDVEELSNFINIPYGQPMPNSTLYLIFKNTAEYHMIMISRGIEEKNRLNMWIPKISYEKAAKYSVRLGHKTEANVLNMIKDATENCIDLFCAYNKEVIKNPYFKLTEDDYNDFKEAIINTRD